MGQSFKEEETSRKETLVEGRYDCNYIRID